MSTTNIHKVIPYVNYIITQNIVWGDELSLWKDAVEKSPESWA